MSSYVPAALRRNVFERSNGVCEYCLVHKDNTYLGCEIEHAISEKHGGATVSENLAVACLACNRFKGTDIASLTLVTRQLVRLFNPRTDRWLEHFELRGAVVHPLTDIGEVTVRLLCINDEDCVELREILRGKGRYPSPEAMRYIKARISTSGDWLLLA